MKLPPRLARTVGLLSLCMGALAVSGCGENGTPGVGDVCPGLECSENGIAEGNASISGYGAIDGFFGSVVKFKDVAGSVSGSLKADLDDIQAGFGISDTDLSTNGSLGAAVKAKLDVGLEGGIKIVAEPAKCAVDARVTVEAQASCEVEAGCDAKVEPGMVMVECKGSCEAEASAMASCEGDLKASCSVKAPSFACTGQCNGTCTLKGAAAAKCEGSCSGKCNGTCEGECSAKDASGKCTGTCSGTCKGSCDADCTLDANLTAECDGTCSGECTYEPGAAGCDAMATVKCEASASASVMCSGKCDGEVVPPKASVDCDASASCQASAKADASLDVQCTPPSVDIKYAFKANVDAKIKADLEFGLNRLRAKLPSILVSLRKGDLVLKAGANLVADAEGAVEGTIDGIAKGDLDFVAAYRITTCVPSQLKAVGGVITSASGDLTAQVEAAGSIKSELGM